MTLRQAGVASPPYLRGKLCRDSFGARIARLGSLMMFLAWEKGCGARTSRAVLRAMALVAATMLAGCGATDSLFVDPGHYSAYHCKDLIAESQNLAKREKELRNLMDKASEGGGGSVIGTFAYRSDYEIVLEQQKLLKRAVAAQKCELVPSYNSDQIIR